jgi:hypothetical protein
MVYLPWTDIKAYFGERTVSVSIHHH